MVCNYSRWSLDMERRAMAVALPVSIGGARALSGWIWLANRSGHAPTDPVHPRNQSSAASEISPGTPWPPTNSR